MIKRALDIITTAFIILVALIVLSGYFPDQLIFMSYVRSNSMEPTMYVGDVFFVVPKFLAGESNVGDVVVFRFSGESNLIVHRIVDATLQGFVTRGDNSPFTDQQGDRPFVKDEMVIGKVASLQGRIILIPKLGILIYYLSYYVKAYFLYVIILLLTLGALSMQKDRSKRKARERRRKFFKIKYMYLLVFLIILLAATFFMLIKTGPLKIDYLSSPYAKPGDVNAVLPNINITRLIVLENSGFIPYYTVVQAKSSNVYINETDRLVWPLSSLKVPVVIKTNSTTGWHSVSFEVGTYMLILPPQLIDYLSPVNIYLPIAVMVIVLGCIGIAAFKVFEIGDRERIFRRNRFRLLKIRLERIIFGKLNR